MTARNIEIIRGGPVEGKVIRWRDFPTRAAAMAAAGASTANWR